MSFGWLGVFREGQWRAFRRFILQEMRDAPSRIAVINAELERIGQITLIYDQVEISEGVYEATEARRGVLVTPNSSLEKLLQAYIAQGGNPFDISMFLRPDETLTLQIGEENAEIRTSPHQGVVAPRTVDNAEMGTFDGGYLPLSKYLPARLGSRSVVWDKTVPIVEAVSSMRRWVSQEIREKRHRLEHRIIKLCDLREQLLLERDEWIEQALGGSISGVRFREEYHSTSKRIQNLIHVIDQQFYGVDEVGRLSFDLPSTVSRVTGRYQTLLDDLEDGQEDWTAL